MTSYVVGSDLPDLKLHWRDADKATIDLSTGWTVEARIGKMREAPTVTKTAGITLAASNPNVTISWVAGELDGLAVGKYQLLLVATRDSDSKERCIQTTITIEPTTAA